MLQALLHALMRAAANVKAWWCPYQKVVGLKGEQVSAKIFVSGCRLLSVCRSELQAGNRLHIMYGPGGDGDEDCIHGVGALVVP